MEIDCWTRKIKCDEVKPTCSNCKRKGLDCMRLPGGEVLDAGYQTFMQITHYCERSYCECSYFENVFDGRHEGNTK
jgi:hypothetical protein